MFSGIPFKNLNPLGFFTKIKLFFKEEYFKSPVAKWLVISGLVANLADWLALRLFLRPVTDTVIIHYNVYFGVDMIGDPDQAYWLPTIGLILFSINFLFSIYFYAKKERIATHILLMASLMIQLSLMVAIASVIIINY
ncbi:MAG: hypothetical protein HGB08_01335 [Candidatus Moranbacteria bacterium]|nr:hypothetical protein [Candidatus Moranbacteria bacterium]